MKALFVGLGSIGTRHLQNLVQVCPGIETIALRSSRRPLPRSTTELLSKEIYALEPGEIYDLCFITGPTHLHAASIAALKGHVGAFFIEKPLFESTGYSLEELGLAPNQKAYIAAPMRWCGVYRALKRHLAQLPVYSVRAICSSYLPEWRPAVDYREVYSAHRAMGGGVALDLIHEWDYLVDLFGFPKKCRTMSGTFSHLEIDSIDLAVYIAEYPRFLCELHLDYFGKEYRRELEIFSEQGSLRCDFGNGILTLPDGAKEDHAEPANARYEREMAYFWAYALGPQMESINSPQKALDVLRLALGETTCQE